MGKISGHLRSNVVGYVALFFALSLGTAWAAGLDKNEVKSKHIGKGQVRTADLANQSVTSPKVADGSLLEEDFAAGELPAGVQGESGPQGLRGPQGLPGPQGLKGPPGPSTGPAGGDLQGSYPNPTLRSAPPFDLVGDGDGPAFTGGNFENVGAPYSTAAFTNDRQGFVHLRGLIENVSGFQVDSGDALDVFTLPSGYRPSAVELHTTNTAGGLGIVQVFPSGVVSIYMNQGSPLANNGYASLDGVIFRAAE